MLHLPHLHDGQFSLFAFFLFLSINTTAIAIIISMRRTTRTANAIPAIAPTVSSPACTEDKALTFKSQTFYTATYHTCSNVESDNS